MFVITFARLYAEVCAIPCTEQVRTGQEGGNLFIVLLYRIVLWIMFG